MNEGKKYDVPSPFECGYNEDFPVSKIQTNRKNVRRRVKSSSPLLAATRERLFLIVLFFHLDISLLSLFYHIFVQMETVCYSYRSVVRLYFNIILNGLLLFAFGTHILFVYVIIRVNDITVSTLIRFLRSVCLCS